MGWKCALSRVILPSRRNPESSRNHAFPWQPFRNARAIFHYQFAAVKSVLTRYRYSHDEEEAARRL